MKFKNKEYKRTVIISEFTSIIEEYDTSEKYPSLNEGEFRALYNQIIESIESSKKILYGDNLRAQMYYLSDSGISMTFWNHPCLKPTLCVENSKDEDLSMYHYVVPKDTLINQVTSAFFEK